MARAQPVPRELPSPRLGLATPHTMCTKLPSAACMTDRLAGHVPPAGHKHQSVMSGAAQYSHSSLMSTSQYHSPQPSMHALACSWVACLGPYTLLKPLVTRYNRAPSKTRQDRPLARWIQQHMGLTMTHSQTTQQRNSFNIHIN